MSLFSAGTLALIAWGGPWWTPHFAPPVAVPPAASSAAWVEFVQAPCGLPLVREAREACRRRGRPCAGVAIEAVERQEVCTAKVTCFPRD